MKANLFAVVLSLSVVSFPIQSASVSQSASAAVVSNHQSIAKIDLNKADAKALSKSVKGIGIKRAEAIIEYRETHGGFKSIEELSQVRGLGKQFVKNNLVQLEEVFMVG